MGFGRQGAETCPECGSKGAVCETHTTGNDAIGWRCVYTLCRVKKKRVQQFYAHGVKSGPKTSEDLSD